jgi:hypothetical protein
MTLKCPESTQPCSNNTLPDDTYCYSPEDLKTKCPINEIEFFENGKANNITNSTSISYAATNGTSYNLVFGKHGSTKPITTTKLEVKPCQIPA